MILGPLGRRPPGDPRGLGRSMKIFYRFLENCPLEVESSYKIPEISFFCILLMPGASHPAAASHSGKRFRKAKGSSAIQQKPESFSEKLQNSAKKV